ncbi:MAG: hypothetical protein AAGG09_22055 [Pseudomonadota bacterium]
MSDKPDPKEEPKNKAKLDWMKATTGYVALSESNQEDLDNRADGQEVIAALAGKKDEIRNVMLAAEFTVKNESGIGSKTMKLLSEEGNYREEIDTVHHGPALLNAAVDPAPLQKAYDEILKIRDSLKDNPYYFPPEPDYTEVPTFDPKGLTEEQIKEKLAEVQEAQLAREKEMREYALKLAEAEQHVAEDLWHPLVREGIIPENLVPQKHSSVAQLFAASSEKYEERLQEYSRDLTQKDILKEKFDLGYKIAGSTLKLMGAANTLGSEVSSMTGDTKGVATTEEIGEFLGHVETALTIGEQLSTAALTDKDFSTVGQTIANTVFENIAGELDPAAAKIVGSCLANGARMVDVSQKIKEGDYQGAFEGVVAGIAAEMHKYDPQGKNGLMSEIANELENSVKSVSAVGNIAVVANKPDAKPGDIMAALLSAANAVGADAGADVDSLALQDFSETALAMQAAWDGGDEARLHLDKKFTEQDLEELRKKRAEMEDRAAESLEREKELAEEKLKAQEKEFEVLMRTGLAKPQTDEEEINLQEYLRSESIETILAIQAKNDATFNFCKTIAEKGVGFVTKLFPPASIAEACLTLAFTIKDAVEKAEQLIIWRENVEDALTAHSAQADAMLNRKGLQTKQTTLAGIQVALDAAKVVAEVLALTPVAPASPVVKASINAAEAAIELSDLLYTETQLAAAWKIYQKAKDTPDDRYLARKSMRENPTLSKYAMAYGALKGDPIAVEGMRRCGLSKITLANPDANVDKVVTYLETKYPDDPVLLRAVPVPDKWYPGPIELTTKCWMMFYNAAITGADLKEADTSSIAAAIALVDEAQEEFETALDKAIEEAKQKTLAEAGKNPVTLDQRDYAKLLSACMRLQDVLRGFDPKQTDGRTAHESFAKFTDALAAKSEQRVASINQILKDEPWVRHYKSAKDAPTEIEEREDKSLGTEESEEKEKEGVT